MRGSLSLKQLTLNVWLVETIRNAPAPGITLSELQKLWKQKKNHTGLLVRSTMTAHRKEIEAFFGVVIDSPNKKHYRIKNPEQLSFNTLANELLASVQEYLFLDEYRDLGNHIQPEQILAGREYLHPIGDAIRHHNKLCVRYQKFTDSEPYEAILHPYCLKADRGRWYLLAHKENSQHTDAPVQHFALDRTLALSVLTDTFKPMKDLDLDEYYRDCFGVYHDYETYPVRDVLVAVRQWVAPYLRTLPIHHSQCEVEAPSVPQQDDSDDWVYFRYHLSPSPDFQGELAKWGDDARIVE